MSSESLCPRCGAALKRSETDVFSVPDHAPLAVTVETTIPRTRSTDEDETPGSPDGSLDTDEVSSADFATSPLLDPLTGMDANPPLAMSSSSGEVLHGLALDVTSYLHPPADALEEDRGRSSPSRSSVLLRSYASAVTLALVASLWWGFRKGPTVVDTLPRQSRQISGTGPSADPEVQPDQTVGLGETALLGDLEIEARSIRLEKVELHRQVGGEDSRDQSVDPVLLLELGLRNRSTDHIFAPFDKGFLRNSDRSLARMRIVGASSSISSYPLAENSEMAIVGQSFDELPPGSSTTAILASDGKPDLSASSSWTWLVPIRVAPGEVRILGVKFSPKDLP